METAEEHIITDEDFLNELASEDIAENPEPVKPKKNAKKESTWGLKKKKELNEEILKEIQLKLAEAWELMGTEYGRKLIEDVAIEVKKLCIINDLP
jgi:hypothetical protein